MWTSQLIPRGLFVAIAVCCFSSYSHGQSFALTGFSGIQRNEKLTFESAPGTVGNFIKEFDPQTFGVFGVRFSHGKLVQGEHTLAYAPNFLDGDSQAFIYHSNLRVQFSIWILKPYATGGIGLINSYSSDSNPLSSFGTKFAFNYGGGTDIMFGLVGVNLDVRGYGVPKVTVEGFSVQQRLDFVQASVGIVFRF
jgi:hypothetical protein